MTMKQKNQIPAVWTDLLNSTKVYLDLNPKACPELDKLQDTCLAVIVHEQDEAKAELEAAYTRNR